HVLRAGCVRYDLCFGLVRRGLRRGLLRRGLRFGLPGFSRGFFRLGLLRCGLRGGFLRFGLLRYGVRGGLLRYGSRIGFAGHVRWLLRVGLGAGAGRRGAFLGLAGRGGRTRHHLVRLGLLHGGARGIVGDRGHAQGLLPRPLSAPVIHGGVQGKRSARTISTSWPTLTTSPTTTIAGGRIPAADTRSATVESEAVTARWGGRVPSCTAITGGSGGRPYRMRACGAAVSRSTAIMSTRVPRDRAIAGQSTVDRGSPGGTCTEITWNSWLTPRCVTGTSAAAGTETALVMPGTTSTGMPAWAQAIISSPPRPNTNGSPPLSRTTNLPSRARSTSSSLILSWDRDRP